MPEYLAPGVYVEEVSFRAKSIEGVSTSTTAFVGPTRRGPLTAIPEVITSVGEFERLYGGLANLSFGGGSDAAPDATNYLPHAVRGFFDNGGKRLYLARTFVPRTDALGTVTSSGIAAVTLLNSGGKKVEFLARVPGSGLNGKITVYQKRTMATAVTLKSAPEGSLTCTGGATPAKPAQLSGGTPPFTLNNGDKLELIIGATTKSITINGIAAEVIAAAAIADPPVLSADTNLLVSVNGGNHQTISIKATDVGSLADLLSLVNSQLKGAYARLEGGDRLAIGTDRCGDSAQVTVRINAELGFTAEASASGAVGSNVADLQRVTVAEINTLLQDAAINVTASLPPASGLLSLATTASGAAVSLQVVDNAARIAFGLPTTAANGTDGNTLLYYEKRGESWIGGADGVSTLDLASISATELLTINLEAADADNSVTPYADLGFAATHPRSIGTVLCENPARKSDALINPYWLKTTGAISSFELQGALFGSSNSNSFQLAGGNDGAEPVAETTVAGAVSYGKGLELLELVEDISIIAAPGHSALTSTSFLAVQQALISHAERLRYRIAVLDTPPGQTVGEARETRSQIDSTRAALYYPWVMVANPLARPGNERYKRELALPPSGFVTGVYARTDVERGVWKAPANEIVRGALRFEQELSHGQQEVLNPEGINCLRFFSGRGYRVWGARTASSDPEWKYVNVRRYFIYLERSIDRSTQWAVFEPNGERLWANIRDTVSAFLYNEWRSGALLGTTTQEAYFVRCDRSTMTQNDLDNGRLICEIGVAALKPAEFVIFRIGQKTADARS